VTDDESKREIREKYVAHLGRMLVLSGVPAAGAAGQARAVLALETRMAEASMTKTEKRDPHAVYNKFESAAALAEGTGSTAAPWVEYFAVYGLENSPVILDNKKLASALSTLLEDRSVTLDTWKVRSRPSAAVRGGDASRARCGTLAC
jgi:putative endopeptidase